jgi:hypothetical protein
MVVDLWMPGGVEATGLRREVQPETTVVVLPATDPSFRADQRRHRQGPQHFFARSACDRARAVNYTSQRGLT